MANLLKTGFLLGLGAAVTSKEKVEKYLEELVSKGKVTPTEAEEMYNSLIKKGEETEDKWSGRAKERMKKAMDDLDMASRADIESLETRVEELEVKVADITREQRANQPLPNTDIPESPAE